jgi:hypothetical protein
MGAVFVGSVIETTYLAEVRVLARGVLDHASDARVVVLVVDARPGDGGGEPFELITPADVGIDERELARRAAMYPPQALVSSLKPMLLRHLIGDEPALLLDADMLVLGDLGPLADPAREHDVVLIPHDSAPPPHTAGVMGFEQTILRHGVFNGGALACGAGAGPFLDWWAQRTARDCIVDLDRALVMSQNWLTLVPAYFDHHVVRDRGINAMGHNLGDDDIDWGDPGRPAIGGVPLRLFHFSGGFDPREPPALFDGRWPWWPDATRRPGLARLCERYAQLLLAAGWEHARGQPPTLDVAGSVALDELMRQTYREALLAAEHDGTAEPPAPLAEGAEAFLAWLAAPVEPGSAVSRWLRSLWAARPDLRAAFPAVPGDDEAALVAWSQAKGAPGPFGLPLAARHQ